MKKIVFIAGFVVLFLAVISARNLLMNDYIAFFDRDIKNIDDSLDTINNNLNAPLDAFGIQNAKLIVNSNGDYELKPNVLKKDVPVKIEVDLNSVYGCARSIMINDFNVFKNVRQGDNIIEFTPTKEGRIRIQCSMNMYTGYFDVVSDVSKIETIKTEAYEKNKIVQSDNQNQNMQKPSCGCGGRF